MDPLVIGNQQIGKKKAGFLAFPYYGDRRPLIIDGQPTEGTDSQLLGIFGFFQAFRPAHDSSLVYLCIYFCILNNIYTQNYKMSTHKSQKNNYLSFAADFKARQKMKTISNLPGIEGDFIVLL
jgi:hypothetical protein